jgi:6-phosphogluconolactonase
MLRSFRGKRSEHPLELDVQETPEAASRAAAEVLAAAARGGGHVALSGGSTPRRSYELAAELAPDWSPAELWWADERCVPPDDERSNFHLAREALLDRLAVPPRSVHRILGELDPQEAARRYDEELRGVTLDLVLLGIGADGHTASLFPDDDALQEEERLAVAVERPDVARVTLTPAALRGAGDIVFLVVGEDKAEAVRRAFAEKPSPGTPASLIRGERTTAILDGDAASALSG